MASADQAPDRRDDKQALAAPSIALPKGGGALRGMGEKFAANPVTGTGSISVPIATSPGRGGFGPQLALAYDSGAGNGPFGFGWSLALPAITRKTDQGLPQYDDTGESDVFILSGAEDLVPEYRKDGAGEWVLAGGSHVVFEDLRTVGGVTYRVRRYRPRVEGLFARIERWTNPGTGDVRWRSISKDNVTTWYGADANSRIADPADPTRIFSWLICETYDDKGNVVAYHYKAEDSVAIDAAQAHEANRTPQDRSTYRYPKRIRYGNRAPYFPVLAADQPWPAAPGAAAADGSADWLFEVVFDYGDHDAATPRPRDALAWKPRQDPFSTYRAGFEVRTYRLCRRVLMFHHFAAEPGVGVDCLVRSTDFAYSREPDPRTTPSPVYSFLTAVTQSGYQRQDGGYLQRSLPPLEFEYSQPVVQDVVEEVDAASLENLPVGLDGAAYQWTDLHGEGIPGILAEQAGAWFYKRNLSPINAKPGNGTGVIAPKFAPVELVGLKPSLTLAGGAQFMDLAGDGQPDLVVLDGAMPGFYEHDAAEGWRPFRPFTAQLNRSVRDPNVKFVDLDGDGHADVLITEDDAFVWHPSLAEAGFGPARRVAQALDEEKGPRLVFADETQSIYLADLSGDGLTDLARVRNGAVCYWPNLGYGRFGAKVTMDRAPLFDHADAFDQKRVRLADVDGSGTTDIIYLHRDGVRLYFNQSGNSWSEPHVLAAFPRVDDLVAIAPTDLLGNGTACLVWSSPLAGDAPRPMRYVNLMGGQKPHLLVSTKNNLGAETRVQYAPSTKFYLQDKLAGKPWITRLPFPVHVVERVETVDHIGRNRFVTRYAYHHGYFDGEEREFRGFGLVEQWDTEELAVLADGTGLPHSANEEDASHVPPVLTRTWFHTGTFVGRDHVSDFFAGLLDAGDAGEYFREPGLTDAQARALLLDDTVLPGGLTPDEEREACRALKGAMLRQEVYALDGAGSPAYPYGYPYTVAEQNFTVRPVQPRGAGRHAVFFTHPRDALTYHYERTPADPRLQHAMTLEVDAYGNVLKSAAIGYGRRRTIRVVDEQGAVVEAPNPGLNALDPRDQVQQTRPLVTVAENRVTRPVDGAAHPDAYRAPLPAEARTDELTGYTPTGPVGRFQAADFVRPDPADAGKLVFVFDGEIAYEQQPAGGRQRRPIEHLRTLYRKDDLSALLPLGGLEPLAVPGESYRLAYTPGLIDQVFRRTGQALLPIPATVLGGAGVDRGGFVDLDGTGHWWIPSGRTFFSPRGDDTAAQERAYAQLHFFLPVRYRDPFHSNAASTESLVTYDAYDLLMVATRDALGNVVTVRTQDDAGAIAIRNNYRVLQPEWVTDPNGNRTRVVFDALGLVAGTAVMGKASEALGDVLDAAFDPNPTQAQVDAFVAGPRVPGATAEASAAAPIAYDLLGKATTRIVYDLDRFRRLGEPPFAAILARETHVHDLQPNEQAKIRVSVSYSDGFGREIQKKIQAEPGPGPKRDGDGRIVVGADGQPELTASALSPRWVGSGWTVFNNKGRPVRQYEPFFADTHRFEFDVRIGVSPVLFYDPAERVVATLHPNHTYEKVAFDPWQQTTYDSNDTAVPDAGGRETGDPRTDPDIGGYVREYFRAKPATWKTWHSQRMDRPLSDPEREAALQAAAHANTPTVAHFDALGRPFLTLAHNRFERNGAVVEERYATRVELDVEGNQRAVRDAVAQDNDPLGRIVMRYDYDMLGAAIHQASMEAGERWILNDVAGKPIRAWDSRGAVRRMTYDALRRPTGLFVAENGVERLAERTVYGEGQGDAGNHRTRVYQVFDGAGVVTHDAYDFKGNLRASTRALLPDYRQGVDWRQAPAPTDGAFATSTRYDALNRPLRVTAPDGSIYRPAFNEANLLEKVDVALRGVQENGQPKWTPFVADVDYDARGQRTLIVYGNGSQSSYEYDPFTLRLARLRTTRPAGLNGLAPIFADPAVVQDLRYTYDPAGNITRIEDRALKTALHANQRVEPVCTYTYDAVYRLVEATGREHVSQAALDSTPPPGDRGDRPFLGHQAGANDLDALRTYVERYAYDAVGNFDNVQHTAGSGSWTRRYAYEEASLVEPGKRSNRLTRTTVGNGGNAVETYSYRDAQGDDVHGCMTAIGGLKLTWDFEDQLKEAELDGGGTAYYVYDAGGQRVRKVIHRPNGTRKEERLYLGGFEVYREYGGDGQTVSLARETLHVMDDKQRIALVETKTAPAVGQPLVRYQLGTHLGSASVELDAAAALISYEEYHPYGTTAFQAKSSAAEVSLKRYRYTGKERDEETGLYYHGARYYAVWAGRWIASDPIGLGDGVNTYAFTTNNPVRLRDIDGKQGTASAPVIRLTLTPEQERVMKENEKMFDAVEQDLERRANAGEFAKGKGTSLPKPSVQPPRSASQPQKETSAKPKHEPSPVYKGPAYEAAKPLPDDAVRLERGNEGFITSESALGGFAFTTGGQLRDDVRVYKYIKEDRDPNDDPRAQAAARSVWMDHKVAEIHAQLGLAAAPASFPQPEPTPTQWGAPLAPASSSRTPLMTYSYGYFMSYDLAQAGQTLVLGKYPGNVQYVRANPGTFTIDRPWGWSPMYNAGGVRGALEARGKILFTSDDYTGTFGREAVQVYTTQGYMPPRAPLPPRAK